MIGIKLTVKTQRLRHVRITGCQSMGPESEGSTSAAGRIDFLVVALRPCAPENWRQK